MFEFRSPDQPGRVSNPERMIEVLYARADLRKQRDALVWRIVNQMGDPTKAMSTRLLRGDADRLTNEMNALTWELQRLGVYS